MLGVPLSMLKDKIKTWVTKSALEVATYMEEVESRAGQDIWDRENMVSICRRFTAVPSEVWGTLIKLRWRRIELQRAAVDSYSRAADKEVGNDWEADIRGWDTEEAAWVEKSFLPPLMSKKWELKDDRVIDTPTYIRVPAEEVAKELELLLLPRFHGKRKGALLQAPEDKEGLASKNNWVEYMSDIFGSATKMTLMEVRGEVGSQEAFEWLEVFKAIEEWGYVPLLNHPGAVELLAYLMQTSEYGLKRKICRWKNESAQYVLRRVTSTMPGDNIIKWGYEAIAVAGDYLADLEDVFELMLEENATPIYDMLVDRCCRNAEVVEAWRRETYDTDIPVMCHLEGGDTGGEPVHSALGDTPTEEWEEWLPPGEPWPRTASRSSVVDPVGGYDGELSYEEELLLAGQEWHK